MKVSYLEKRKIQKFVDSLAINKLTGFFPSFVSKNLNVNIAQVTSILDDLVREGVLGKEFILYNPDNFNEKAVFKTEDEVKRHLYSFYDEFNFGESFYVEPDMIFVFYTITEEYREAMREEKEQIPKKLYRLVQVR
ncbi:hypothetical protein [Enterococcus xiangfangensis]|uniref:hypothetical protein n=1 Tax=Enterococcus xiangfangensis TaxID=1296537 RepID=UPI003D1703BD|nr:hypothetical protein [Enterococcus asini]